MKLIQLPNGSWVDPDSVKAIRPLQTTQPTEYETEVGTITGSLHLARVLVVDHGNGFHEVILANDDEDAVRLAGEIAAQLNERRTA